LPPSSGECKENELAVFFRNNHFSTLTKHGEHLYLLATDIGYLHEADLVWERLNQVDGDTLMCDSNFRTLDLELRAAREAAETAEAAEAREIAAAADREEHEIAAQYYAAQQQQQQRTPGVVHATYAHPAGRYPGGGGGGGGGGGRGGRGEAGAASDYEIALALQREEDRQAAEREEAYLHQQRQQQQQQQQQQQRGGGARVPPAAAARRTTSSAPAPAPATEDKGMTCRVM
jgi:hypothetical protein